MILRRIAMMLKSNFSYLEFAYSYIYHDYWKHEA